MDSIQEALDALQRGEREQAMGVLGEALQANPRDGQAWMWMAAAQPDPQKKRYCLERALAVSPGLSLARQALAQMNESGSLASGAQTAERLLMSQMGKSTSPSETGPDWLASLREEAPAGPSQDKPLVSDTPSRPVQPEEIDWSGRWSDFTNPGAGATEPPSPAEPAEADWTSRRKDPNAGRSSETEPDETGLESEAEAAPPQEIDWSASLRGDTFTPDEPTPLVARSEDQPGYVFETLAQRIANVEAERAAERAAARPAGKKPVKAAPAKAKPSQTAPTRRRNPILSCLIVLLALVAFAALSLVALIGLQAAGALPVIPGMPNFGLVPPTATSLGVEIVDTPTQIVLPPTWTPTQGLPPSLTPIPTRRVVLPLPSPTPAVSFTPPPPGLVYAIGSSVSGQTLQVYRFGTGKQTRLLVMGIHAGDERFTIQLADQLIESLRKDPAQVPGNITLYIVRALDADGEARQDDPAGRLNANGVDLDRNFPLNWKGTWDTANCPTPAGTAGERAGSEPETRAMMQFIRTRPVEIMVNVQGGKLGVFPANMANTTVDPESFRLGKNVSQSSGVPLAARSACEQSGRLVDWAADNGVWSAVDLHLANNSRAYATLHDVMTSLFALSLPSPTPTVTPTGSTDTPEPPPTITPTR